MSQQKHDTVLGEQHSVNSVKADAIEIINHYLQKLDEKKLRVVLAYVRRIVNGPEPRKGGESK